MTEYTSEKLFALKERLEKSGYILYHVTHFKYFDRIHFGNSKIKVSINLRGKLSELALDTLVEACIGKKENP